MKKRVVILSLVVFIVGFSAIKYKEPIKDAVYEKVTDDMFVSQDNDEFDPGPAVGESFPGISAIYQGAVLKDLQSLMGEKGVALVASRSFEWCPYCMRQLIQLQEHNAKFQAAGIELVAITYDPPELQQVFIEKHDISIPILSDIDAISFKNLGILNADYQPDDDNFGLPYPGMIVVNKEGVVVGKLFLEGYTRRVDSEASLSFAIEAIAE